MPVYEYKGSPKQLTIGRSLTAFRVSEAKVNGNKVIASGEIAFNDIIAGSFKRPERFSIAWRAESFCHGGTMSSWQVSQQVGKEVRVSPTINEAVQSFVKEELVALVESGSIFVATGHGSSTSKAGTEVNGGEKIPAVRGNYPANWAQGWRPVKKPVYQPKPNRAPEPKPEPPPTRPALPACPIRGGVVRPVRADRTYGKANGEGLKLYSGKVDIYLGPCLCDQLEESSERFPFVRPQGIEFPERCFECSCGQRWWSNRPHENYWIRVADFRAWCVLCRFNGVPSQTLAYEGEVLYLLETLQHRVRVLPVFVHQE